MARTDVQFNFRIESENLQIIKTTALKERRSLTAQINFIIAEWHKRQEEVKA